MTCKSFNSPDLDKLKEKGYIKAYQLDYGQVELIFPDGTKLQVWYSQTSEDLICDVIDAKTETSKRIIP